ncbi:FMN-binding glutamate synthase family protein [Parvibaculum sp.]|uniref:FMN-binding glutamate synthase family protein n=1 Tax=Parvibaculum sp. TaxID=2024848 RepID=UPI000C8E29C7|nr:FMN-binding glutamate synthase family protein [Parvibaculum sp.]MAB12846.1 FMN-binding glutamate synthase family protein [Parvibaculum sp.]
MQVLGNILGDLASGFLSLADNDNFIWKTVDLLSALFVVAVGLAFLAVIVVYVIDRTQTTHAIRRNYPVIGRLRYVFEALGEYFRQYFFAMDREELPFNRAQRSWVYRAAKGVDTTVAFGSSRDIRPAGTINFVNTPFPTLDQNAADTAFAEVGPFCRHPYRTASIFNISGMSFGAISKPAIRALSRGAKKAGIWMNTGEGGLSPYHLEGGADIVFQIGTAKYGCRNEAGAISDTRLVEIAAHDQVKMFEIKLSQGAKPGKGGMLPKEKISREVSAIRGIPQGEDSISPNRHPEISTIGDLLDMVEHVREVTGKPTGFKMVIGAYGWLDEFCEEIQRRGVERAPDFITVDSADGGTGAAPMPLIDYVGLPIWESLPMLCDILARYGLKKRIRVIASGKLINPAEVAWALCVGADFVTSARGFMFALGCIQSLQCNKNTCPTGIATHKKKLQRGLDVTDKSERVRRYAERVSHEVCMIAHSCGCDEPRKLTREQARIMGPSGVSVSLAEYYERWSAPHSIHALNGIDRPKFEHAGLQGSGISTGTAAD